MDLSSVSKIRTLSKQRYRKKREMMEMKTPEEMKKQFEQLTAQRETQKRQQRINDLIQTIKAAQLIGAEDKVFKRQLHQILIPSKAQ